MPAVIDFTFDQTALDKVLLKMRRIPERVQRRIIRATITRAGNPPLKAWRALAREHKGDARNPDGSPRKHYYKTIAKRVKWQWRKSTYYAIIGPRSREAPHANLLEGGVRPHSITITRGPRAGAVIRHPGHEAFRIGERAYRSTIHESKSIVERELSSRVEAEMASA